MSKSISDIHAFTQAALNYMQRKQNAQACYSIYLDAKHACLHLIDPDHLLPFKEVLKRDDFRSLTDFQYGQYKKAKAAEYNAWRKMQRRFARLSNSVVAGGAE